MALTYAAEEGLYLQQLQVEMAVEHEGLRAALAV